VSVLSAARWLANTPRGSMAIGASRWCWRSNQNSGGEGVHVHRNPERMKSRIRKVQRVSFISWGEQAIDYR
jgi:hypothetical protein